METAPITHRLQADDLFAGAGGWDVAADWLDVHARGVENMAEARQTRDAAGLTTIHDDVWTFKPRYRAMTDAEVYAEARATGSSHHVSLIAAGLIASPPCQTFSKAGSGSGRKALNDVLALLPDVATMTLPELRKAGEVFGDDRTALVLTPLWFALHHPYRWLAWEQVPTVLPVWEACAQVLREHGWNVWTGNLNAEQYGVPQTRRRAFLIASRDHTVTPPTPTHSQYHSRTPSKLDPGVRKWVSMAEALGWGAIEHDPCTCPATFTATNDRPNVCHRPPCRPAPTLAFGHETPRWNPRETFPCWYCSESRTANGCDNCDAGPYNPRETTPDGRPRFAQQSDNVPDYAWPDNRPATVVAGRDLVQAPGATANRFNNSTKSRNDGVRVSVAEAGVLQSFPADFPWQGKQGKQYLQAGNAVPPLLAMAALSSAIGEPYLPPSLTASTETPEPAQPALANL